MKGIIDFVKWKKSKHMLLSNHNTIIIAGIDEHCNAADNSKTKGLSNISERANLVLHNKIRIRTPPWKIPFQ